jgi:hypothetical protein
MVVFKGIRSIIMIGLYKFEWDCGRQGTVNGLFLAASEDIDKAIGKQVYFGEILGKHSEIYGMLDSEDLTKITEDPAVIKIFQDYKLSSGYCPLDFIEEETEEEEADEDR